MNRPFSPPRNHCEEIANARAGYFSLPDRIKHSNRDVRIARSSKMIHAVIGYIQGWFILAVWVVCLLVAIATPPILLA